MIPCLTQIVPLPINIMLYTIFLCEEIIERKPERKTREKERESLFLS
jgi:hypothetical protein